MAFRIVKPISASRVLGMSLGAAGLSLTFSRPSPFQVLHCDARAGSVGASDSWSFSRGQGALGLPEAQSSPATYRQLSSGSILGLLGGVAVSVFSKPLAFFLGLLVFGVQFAASKGINLIPYNRIQRYVKGIDLRSAMHENVAFKLAFGTTFALASFAPL